MEELLSAWRGKVYDCQPLQRIPLLQAMEEAWEDIDQGTCQTWIHYLRPYFPRCLAQDNIECDVEKNLWQDPRKTQDLTKSFSVLFC